MKLAFRTLKLRDICEHKSKAITELGASTAEALTDRLADVDAATTLTELRTVLEVRGDASGELLVALTPHVSLRLRPNHLALPRHEDGSVDESRVTRMQVLAIEERAT